MRMLDDPDVYCVDVLKQVKAVQGALSKVSDKVLRSHIRDHVATAAQRGDTEHIVEELMEALNISFNSSSASDKPLHPMERLVSLFLTLSQISR